LQRQLWLPAEVWLLALVRRLAQMRRAARAAQQQAVKPVQGPLIF
jgi:hypothetical protein